MDKHFVPTFDVVNLVRLENMEEPEFNYRRRKDVNKCRVTMRQRVRGVFFEHMELMNFPFDVQSLNVRIRSRFNVEHVVYQLASERKCEAKRARRAQTLLLRGRTSSRARRRRSRRCSACSRRRHPDDRRQQSHLFLRAGVDCTNDSRADPSIFSGSRFMLPEWDFVTPRKENGMPGTPYVWCGESGKTTSTSKPHAYFTFNQPVSRKIGYYLGTVIPTYFLTVCLGWNAYGNDMAVRAAPHSLNSRSPPADTSSAGQRQQAQRGRRAIPHQYRVQEHVPAEPAPDALLHAPRPLLVLPAPLPLPPGGRAQRRQARARPGALRGGPHSQNGVL